MATFLTTTDSRAAIERVIREEKRKNLVPDEYMLTPVRKDFIRELLYLRHCELCKLLERIRG